MSAWSLLGLVFVFSVVFLFLKKLFWVSRIPDLHNKHVLVTGGSSGIGKSVALEAAKLGANVTIIARNKDKLMKTVEEIKRVAKSVDKQKIQYVSLDLTKSYEVVDEAITSIESDVGPIFLLVNCAGMAVCGVMEETSEIDYRYMIDLNYFGTVFPTVAAAKRMKKRGQGYIVITGSQASLLGIYGMSAYCASKFALRGFAESLYMELMPYDVSVTVCLPPDTNTPGFENEEKSKPEVTRMISETAGLFEPEIVAHRLLSDALSKKFFSVVGLEGVIMTTLCAGMSPLSSFTDICLQVSLMSALRLVSIGYLLHFQKLIFGFAKSQSKRKLQAEKVE